MSIDELSRLTGEHAALRRVATLVARGAPADELFAAASEEVGQVLGVDVTHLVRYESDGSVTVVAAWSKHGDHIRRSRWRIGGNNLSTRVMETRRPARIDSYADGSGEAGTAAREGGYRSGVGAPIAVDGRLWGAMSVVSLGEQPLPACTEARLADFTELLATAIANAESRSAVARLAEEQTALRRVATLVARGVPSQELFGAVTEEVGRLLGVEFAGMGRYEADGETVTFVSSWSGEGAPVLPAVSQWPLGGENLSTLIAQTGRPARLDGDADKSGPIGGAVCVLGVHSEVGAPIIVEGRVWGVIVAGSTVEQSLPQDVEARLGSFTELVATAVANAESRAGLARLADEHAALRRIATLVARGVPAEQLFAAVADEAGRLLGVELVALCRYDSDDTVTLVAARSWVDGDLPAIDSTFSLDGDDVPTLVARTGRAAWLNGLQDGSTAIGLAVREAGLRSVVGMPIAVHGQLWGMIAAGSESEEPLPPDTEAQLGAFTDLLATAIANESSRAELAASRARIVAAADEARRRIERDLHDGAQQRLVAVGLELRALQAEIPPERDELNGQLERIARDLARVQDGLRDMARGIHPAILAHGGLEAVLKSVARRSPLPVEIEVRRLGRLPEQVEVAAYYVVSEALTNAAKHAHASLVNIEVEPVDGALRVRISDNGAGGADPSRGSGLVGLKDRAETLGGTFRLHSQPGAGTSIQVEIPVSVT